MNRFIRLNEENIVISVRFGEEIINGEIESGIGELGQRMLSNGMFEDVPIEYTIPDPTIEEQILSENQYQTALLEMQVLGGM